MNALDSGWTHAGDSIPFALRTSRALHRPHAWLWPDGEPRHSLPRRGVHADSEDTNDRRRGGGGTSKPRAQMDGHPRALPHPSSPGERKVVSQSLLVQLSRSRWVGAPSVNLRRLVPCFLPLQDGLSLPRLGARPGAPCLECDQPNTLSALCQVLDVESVFKIAIIRFRCRWRVIDG